MPPSHLQMVQKASGHLQSGVRRWIRGSAPTLQGHPHKLQVATSLQHQQPCCPAKVQCPQALIVRDEGEVGAGGERNGKLLLGLQGGLVQKNVACQGKRE